MKKKTNQKMQHPKTIRVRMEITIDEKDFDAIRRITHHVDELINAANWPEIKCIEAVTIDEVW